MRDRDYYDLRYLTEQIFVLREFALKDISPDDKKYESLIKTYNDLCKERDLIESEAFNERTN